MGLSFPFGTIVSPSFLLFVRLFGGLRGPAPWGCLCFLFLSFPLCGNVGRCYFNIVLLHTGTYIIERWHSSHGFVFAGAVRPHLYKIQQQHARSSRTGAPRAQARVDSPSGDGRCALDKGRDGFMLSLNLSRGTSCRWLPALVSVAGSLVWSAQMRCSTSLGSCKKTARTGAMTNTCLHPSRNSCIPMPVANAHSESGPSNHSRNCTWPRRALPSWPPFQPWRHASLSAARQTHNDALQARCSHAVRIQWIQTPQHHGPCTAGGYLTTH